MTKALLSPGEESIDFANVSEGLVGNVGLFVRTFGFVSSRVLYPRSKKLLKHNGDAVFLLLATLREEAFD